jgi:hypothetical protein
MATVLPKRNEPIVEDNGNTTLRFNRFLNDLVNSIPAVMTNITDVTTGSINPEVILLENKINEILAGMRTAGLME